MLEMGSKIDKGKLIIKHAYTILLKEKKKLQLKWIVNLVQ